MLTQSLYPANATGANPLSYFQVQQLQTQLIGPIDLTIEAGECVCISGPSGSGKTLLLRAIADLDPHTGRLFLNRTECNQFPAPMWRKQVGLLPAENRWWYERIGDHFINRDSIWLEQLGFDQSIFDRPVIQCSTGERQRLSLLRLLQNDLKVLLLDEPTASLDLDNVQRMEQLIKQLQIQRQIAVLWSSHDLQQIKRVADQHYRLKSGKLVESQ